jgi:hypothetical protein
VHGEIARPGSPISALPSASAQRAIPESSRKRAATCPFGKCRTPSALLWDVAIAQRCRTYIHDSVLVEVVVEAGGSAAEVVHSGWRRRSGPGEALGGFP